MDEHHPNIIFYVAGMDRVKELTGMQQDQE
jgi:hypothetical protein